MVHYGLIQKKNILLAVGLCAHTFIKGQRINKDETSHEIINFTIYYQK